MEFELDFGTTALNPNAAPSQGPLLASVDGQVAPLSNSECVFHDRSTGTSHVMTLDVLSAMDSCRRFFTLPEHVSRVEQRLPALKGKSEAIQQVLGFLVNRGLMVTADQMLTGLKTDFDSELAAPIALIIRTCDRPEELARLARSLATYEMQFQRGLRIVVIDDSRQSENAQRNDQAVASLREQGLDVHRLDRQWRERLATFLGREGDDEAARKVLGLGATSRVTCGGAWNAALLLTAGQRFLMLDDDFVVEPKVRQQSGSELSIREPVHVPMSFHGDMDQLEQALTEYSPDPFAQHIDSCGQAPGALFESKLGLTASAASLRGADYRRVRSLANGQSIRTTAGGAWGDWRMDTNLWFYLQPVAQTAGMRESAARYRGLSHRPQLAHAFDRPQLTRQSNFTPLCFDNREILPCTAAQGRGEDYTFAAWVRFVYPDSLCLQWPVMLRHQRPEEARESPHAHAYVPWVSRFAGEYALSKRDHCEASGAIDRMRSLEMTLRDLAAASDWRRQTVLREFLGMMRAQIVQQAQDSLTSLSPAADFWVRDAKEWITANGAALTSEDPPRLRDWPEAESATECADLLARDLNAFADQLHHWPQMWQRCEGRFSELLEL